MNNMIPGITDEALARYKDKLTMQILLLEFSEVALKHVDQMHRPIKEVDEYVCDDDDCNCCNSTELLFAKNK